MGPSLLAGILIAWTVSQLLGGVFFVLAHTLAKREVEYLLFGLLCFALALMSLGIVMGTLTDSSAGWLSAARIGHAAGIGAVVFNLHFALRYSRLAYPRWVVPSIYGVALVFQLANVANLYWRPNTFIEWTTTVLGGSFVLRSAEPTPIALVFYVVTALQLGGSVALIFWAYRSGKREALIAFGGGVALCVAGVHDMLLSVAVIQHSLFLLPHAFMLYAFCVASTLVLRYGLAAGELAQAETELIHATEELRISHASLREVKGELLTKQQLAAVGELAAAIAHEVRNPLAIIMNAVASLRRPNVSDDDRKTLLSIVDEETARLNRLVSDLLRFARPTVLQHRNVDLAELAEASRPPMSHEHEIVVRLADGAPTHVEADPGLLRGALENLIENACQASPAGSTIQVTIGSAAIGEIPCARVEVRDRGAGMEASILSRALDPFFTTRPSGTGLGLPIVQRVARAHGGVLEMESTPGEGTTAALVLPLEQPEQLEPPPTSGLGNLLAERDAR
jgi:signal transduction histidine kinase